MMVKSGQEKVMVIYGRSLCTLLHAASLSVQCTAMHRSAAWLKGGWEELSANLFDTKCINKPTYNDRFSDNQKMKMRAHKKC